MKYKFFDKVYDDEGDDKARNFFQTVKGWLKKLTDPMSISQIRNTFFANSFSKTCLVEGTSGGGRMLLESVQEDVKEVFGADKRSERGLTHTEDLKEAFGTKKIDKKNNQLKEELKKLFGSPGTDKKGSHTQELKEAFTQ